MSKFRCVLLICSGLVFATSTAFAAKPDCELDPTHPKCGDDGGGDPPQSGNAYPQIVYRDGGIFLANEDGKSQTEIRSGGVQPKLDAPGKRVLFYDYPSLGNLDSLRLIQYSIDAGNIAVESEDILLTTADISTPTISGRFTSRGLTDWSPGGNRYAYNIRQDYGDDLGWRYKVMVAPEGTNSPNFADHIVAWDGAPDGGLGFGAWDASGDYIYFFEEFNQGLPQWLIVIDVSTNPAREIKRVELQDQIGETGFAPESNPQHLSASYETGGSDGGYSFDPEDVGVLARSDTSLCLMIPLVDWGYSQRHEARFTMIIDLPVLFDSVSGLSCSLTNAPTATILDFEGTDFTADDAGIIGRDHSKNRTTGVWIYDFSSESPRSKIIGSGGFADWTN